MKKNIIKSMIKKESILSSFAYLTNHVGKGNKSPLSHVITEANTENLKKVVYEKHQVEQLLIQKNRKHFKQAFRSNICSDKYYTKLENEKFQRRILFGTIIRNDFDDDDVFELFTLFKADAKYLIVEHKTIIVEEWKIVVRKTKRKSMSSIFSNRSYQVYKCALHSDCLTSLLVNFINLTIHHSHVCES